MSGLGSYRVVTFPNGSTWSSVAANGGIGIATCRGFPTEAEARAAALKAIRRDATDAAKLMGKVVAAVTAELGDSL